MGEPEPLDQVLVDALGIAPELKLLLDPLPVRLAGRAGLFRRPNRWPGWGFSPASAPGLLPPEPMATPGEFAPVPSLEARSRRRIVLRSTPVRRSISRCPRPWRSSVSTVIRRCDFKTFNSPPPVQIRSSVTSRRLQTLGADRRPFTSGVGEFQVATGGGFWVAARGLGAVEWVRLTESPGIYMFYIYYT